MPANKSQKSDDRSRIDAILHNDITSNRGNRRYPGSVTDDHYTSFVSLAAVERIHTALRAIAPLEELTCPMTPLQEDGTDVQIIAPEHTRQRIGIVEEIILRPGEEIEIICQHSVSGSISARVVDENGKRKRAARKKQASMK